MINFYHKCAVLYPVALTAKVGTTMVFCDTASVKVYLSCARMCFVQVRDMELFYINETKI